MSNARSKKQYTEYGDFQTPPDLAREICVLLSTQGSNPSSILESSCGKGNLLLSALDVFPNVVQAIGCDINTEYVNHLSKEITSRHYLAQVQVYPWNFFGVNWGQVLRSMIPPVLIIGNPPWVTNAALSTLGSTNLPEKSNFQGHSGLDAITGKSNFDISEWMLINLLEAAKQTTTTIAVLCKTIVARKVLAYAWKREFHLSEASIYNIDAFKYFGASVDACLLVVSVALGVGTAKACTVYNSIAGVTPTSSFGYVDGALIANVGDYERWRFLQGTGTYRWRSGIKHDSAKVMELQLTPSGYKNGLGELCELESTYLYPMLKSSDIANSTTSAPTRWMIVTQRHIGESTEPIRHRAPKTWEYLNSHHELLGNRKSSLYRNRPPFSIFGVGSYSFSPWKVAISALYKKLQFALVAPFEGKPVVLDDTCNFIACESKEEATFVLRLLNSEPAQRFISSLIFWDAKRPLTLDILNRLNLDLVANEIEPIKRMLF
jgi:hypothetical protein